ncbi:MAG TPA: FkbM family methyltransferase [Chitinophagales bacterium]|nr:FkbM family methyltransferase [Chitinophagales bacterium]
MEFVKGLYRSLLPKDFRRRIAQANHAARNKSLKNEILKYYDALPADSINPDQREAIDYLRHHQLDVFLHPFREKYQPSDTEVLRDDKLKLPYVVFDGKRLYYKRDWSEARIKEYHNGMLQEQDEQSPHRYLTKSFDVSLNDVVADIGAAEGIFALSIIERVKRVYLFEADEDWLDALRATFEPFQGKVEIIHQAVSNSNDARNTTLDAFFDNKQLNFIKIDVDGGERAALEGAKKLLASNKQLKVALCAYHNQNDEQEFTALLRKNNFNIEAANGFMIFFYDTTLAPPYLRRGVLRAAKQV